MRRQRPREGAGTGTGSSGRRWRRRRRTGRRPRRSWAQHLRRIGLAAGALSLGVPLIAILLLRWVPPPTTAFMVQSAQAHAEAPGWTGTGYRWTAWDDIAPFAGLAVIAAEDQRFPEHHGFDVDAIRAALDDAMQGERLRGASTISQQTVKNLFLWPGRSAIRKGLEAALTVLLELCWSKRRILEVYLNIAEFGDGLFGVTAASERFFGKRPAELGADEAARLAAVLPNPARLRADRPSRYVRARQRWIRNQMDRLGGVALIESLAAR
ncbi:MAG: monofunctional biosynthetic peptidoglycan transglycosylase [Acidobacteria bacterium]|nr:monofunctional biosynthetic peptidoglycan transglycosylase [Acidobacteriota bacterium]